jgi:hypothetical protein
MLDEHHLTLNWQHHAVHAPHARQLPPGSRPGPGLRCPLGGSFYWQREAIMTFVARAQIASRARSSHLAVSLGHRSALGAPQHTRLAPVPGSSARIVATAAGLQDMFGALLGKGKVRAHNSAL